MKNVMDLRHETLFGPPDCHVVEIVDERDQVLAEILLPAGTKLHEDCVRRLFERAKARVQ